MFLVEKGSFFVSKSPLNSQKVAQKSQKVADILKNSKPRPICPSPVACFVVAAFLSGVACGDAAISDGDTFSQVFKKLFQLIPLIYERIY